MVNIALQNSTKLQKYGIKYTLIPNGTKFGAHKRLFTALGTIASRKFGHWPISQKVRGNTAQVVKDLTENKK